MLSLEKKTRALNRIYEIYEKVASTLETACKKYCADCCTCNVTLTTLEAYQIITWLKEHREWDVIHQLDAWGGRLRFQPSITTNRLAELCMRGEEIPQEESDPSWGHCPFLMENACRIYPIRPFGCRCLLSNQKCEETRCAQVPPFVLTVNTVFLQVIEHLDHNGFSGNLTDLVRWLAVTANCHSYQTGGLTSAAQGLVANRPLPCLMIPEEHRMKMRDLLAELQGIDVGG